MMGWITGKLGGVLSSGTAIAAIVAAAFGGLYKCESQKVERAELQRQGLERSLAQAEKEITDAAAIAKHNKAVADAFKHESERQLGEMRALEKKAAARLRENNDLRRKINNVPDNPPIHDALELAIDAARLRGAVPRDAGKDGNGDETGGSEAADPAGRDVPATAQPTS